VEMHRRSHAALIPRLSRAKGKVCRPKTNPLLGFKRVKRSKIYSFQPALLQKLREDVGLSSEIQSEIRKKKIIDNRTKGRATEQ